MKELPQFGELRMYEAIAKYLEVDEAEVVDNCDGKSVTVMDMSYLVIPLELGLTAYSYALIPMF